MAAPGDACSGLSWTIDAWGNRTDQTVTGGTCNTFHAGVGTNNRLVSPYVYDAAGNLTSDGTHTYTYNAENQLIQVDGGSTATYLYDPEGKRVEKISGGVTLAYLYHPNGNLLAEVSSNGLQRGYIYENSRLVAEYENSTTYFIHADSLGSTRLVTGMAANIVDKMDYLPYGEQIVGSSTTSHKFTGKERDSESGLDNFGARYNSSAAGRFMSPDPKHVSAHLSDPQSFNRYPYARNNPLLYVDPDGKDFEKAAQDLTTFAKSIYIKVSVGVGYEAKAKVGAVEAKVGAAAKATAETSQDAILKVSRSAEAGASVGPTNGPKAGENISAEQTVFTINKDGTLTGAEKATVTVTDTIGGNTTVNSAPEQIGLGFEAPLGPEPIVGGAEVGTTREGLNALRDAGSEVKDSLTNPGPPTPPKPPAPPCSGGSNNKCPN